MLAERAAAARSERCAANSSRARGDEPARRLAVASELSPAYWVCMRYAIAMLLALTCLSAQACVTDKKLTPPDSVLDPRGQ
jgi:hypothetical protein